MNLSMKVFMSFVLAKQTNKEWNSKNDVCNEEMGIVKSYMSDAIPWHWLNEGDVNVENQNK